MKKKWILRFKRLKHKQVYFLEKWDDPSLLRIQKGRSPSCSRQLVLTEKNTVLEQKTFFKNVQWHRLSKTWDKWLDSFSTEGLPIFTVWPMLPKAALAAAPATHRHRRRHSANLTYPLPQHKHCGQWEPLPQNSHKPGKTFCKAEIHICI